MGYLGYYVALFALSYLIRQPALLAGLVGLWLLRGLLPPPGALFGALSRAGRLREQVRVNRANITARRDLATLYLSVLRPRRALPLLEEALALAPEDTELLYLHGLALQRAGRNDEALARLLAAIERDPRLRHGQPYFAAGDSLLALQRWDDAADAFERYLDFNSSDVAAHTQLARAYAGGGDAVAARQWLLRGLETWHGLPGAMKRRQLGAYLRAQWARVSVLKQPLAIGVALLLLALSAAGARAAAPVVAQLWRPDPGAQMLARARAAAKLCGSQRVGEFEGRYAVSSALPLGSGKERSAKAERALQREIAARYAGFRIERDRIVISSPDDAPAEADPVQGAPAGDDDEADAEYTQEYCLTRVLERTPGALHAEAIMRLRPLAGGPRVDAFGSNIESEQVALMLMYDVRLDRGAEFTRLRLAPLGSPLAATALNLRRRE